MTSWEECDAALDLESVLEDLYGVVQLLGDKRPSLALRALEIAKNVKSLRDDVRAKRVAS